MTHNSCGSLPSIIRNSENLYEGNLRHYFKTVFHHAQNLNKPYHNFRHMFHIMWLCYQACLFYQEKRLTSRQMRKLLIAALFHDFNHPGMMGDDDLNIERAIRGLKNHLVPEDERNFEDITLLIRATEYPYKVDANRLPLSAQILRDADMGQSFSVAWLQQVVFGLAEEWGKKPIDLLNAQVGFFSNMQFHTEWGRQMFPQSEIDAKIKEVQEFIEALN